MQEVKWIYQPLAYGSLFEVNALSEMILEIIPKRNRTSYSFLSLQEKQRQIQILTSIFRTKQTIQFIGKSCLITEVEIRIVYSVHDKSLLKLAHH